MNELCQKIYEYIKEEIAYSGSLSVRDICTGLDIKSTSTVHKYLNELESLGLIDRSRSKRRNITLNSAPTYEVPVLGTITAGMPITAIEEIEGYIPFTDYKGDSKDLFALRVRGESMIEAGILNGDIIIARRTPVCENGQIAVCLIDDEATVKTFYKEEEHFRLQPENSAMEPIIVEECAILGVVIASLRKYEE